LTCDFSLGVARYLDNYVVGFLFEDPLGREADIRRLLLFAVDLALVIIGTCLAFLLRENFEISHEKALAFWPYLLATALSASFVIPALGLSRSVWRFSTMRDYLHLVFAAVSITLGAVILIFALNRLEGIARSIPFLQPVMLLLLLASARVFMRIRHMNRSPAARQFAAAEKTDLLTRPTVLIVGMNRLAELYLQSALELGQGDIGIAGLIGNDERHTGRLMHRYPVLGVPEDIAAIISDLRVHGIAVQRIVVTVRMQNLSEQTRTILAELAAGSDIVVDYLAATLGFEAHEPVVSGSSDLLESDGSAEPNAERLLSIDDSERVRLQGRGYWLWKRGFDVIGSSILLLLLAPAMALIALVIFFDIGRPVLFMQQRPGLGGRPFRLFKFRTMGAAYDRAGYRVPDDRRLTLSGRSLRRTRLDELPQLFNILLGQMSFIGPRPLLPADQPVGASARLQVRPGLTGWAQVKGGRHLTALDKVALDVWYVRNASVRVDIEILLRTVVMVIFGERENAEAVRLAWDDVRRAKAFGEGACGGATGPSGELAA